MSVKIHKDKYGEYYVEASIIISFKGYIRDADGYCIGSKDSRIPLPDPVPTELSDEDALKVVREDLSNYNSSDLWEEVVNFAQITLTDQDKL